MLETACSQCNHVWSVPPSKKGGSVNCPSCGVLTELDGASDTGWFYGLTFGGFAVLGLPFGVMAVIGILNGSMSMAVCSGSIFVLAVLVLLFVLFGS